MADKTGTFRLTPRAISDLEEIWRYTFKTWSADQADRYHNDIIAVCRDLAAGHKKGRPVSIREGYFKYPSGSHLIFYRLTENGLVVVRILHRRMDVEQHL